MSRIRTIKPDFFRHYELYQAEIETGFPLRVVYPGLWTVADREGRFRWKPEVLKLDVLPYDNIDFSRVLDALITHGFIVKYEVADRVYGWIPTFKLHQVINNRESASILPPPPESVTRQHNNHAEIQIKYDMCSKRQSRVNHASGTRHDLAQGEGEKEREEEKEGIKAFCPAPKKTGAEPETEGAAKPDNAVYEIPIVGAGKSTYLITQPMIDEWQQAYPGIDVDQAIRECRQWNIANPTRRKTSSGIARHVVSWLQREQNRCGTMRRATPGMMKGQSKTYEHNVAAISQAIRELKQEAQS